MYCLSYHISKCRRGNGRTNEITTKIDESINRGDKWKESKSLVVLVLFLILFHNLYRLWCMVYVKWWLEFGRALGWCRDCCWCWCWCCFLLLLFHHDKQIGVCVRWLIVVYIEWQQMRRRWVTRSVLDGSARYGIWEESVEGYSRLVRGYRKVHAHTHSLSHSHITHSLSHTLIHVTHLPVTISNSRSVRISVDAMIVVPWGTRICHCLPRRISCVLRKQMTSRKV